MKRPSATAQTPREAAVRETLPQEPLERIVAGLGALLGAIRDVGDRSEERRCLKCGEPAQPNQDGTVSTLCVACEEAAFLSLMQKGFRAFQASRKAPSRRR